MLPLIILAGGYGTRLSEYTSIIPKPMVPVGNKPILIHLINYYSKFDVEEVFIALGYKKNIIIDFFKKNSSLFIKDNTNKYSCYLNFKNKKIKINLVDTGINTMTGGRVKRVLKYINSDIFLLTYGDGLANVDIKKLINFHLKNKCYMTLTAVRPPARFGYVKLNRNKVIKFREKSQIDIGWINGGFFVLNKKISNLIKDDTTYLEKEPMEILAKKNKLYAFKHNGFWQCMDTKRDKELLDSLFKEKKMPWLK